MAKENKNYPIQILSSGRVIFYDFKRKIDWDTLGQETVIFDGKETEKACYETHPFTSIEEFNAWFDIWKNKLGKRKLFTIDDFLELKSYTDTLSFD